MTKVCRDKDGDVCCGEGRAREGGRRAWEGRGATELEDGVLSEADS